ncbi:MAG: aminotransferase class I/II-fold pyridoxal phosphate-dependent enzyme [Hyphomicrobiaceae bacterium]|nr:aminotransferase class I/II-fold pyridoxal phosphate-dependent enzyme [Hyphomicrobiaceae bacterium]
MSVFEKFDAISVDDLHRTGASKWATEGQIGAFVAEMDFGTAPVVTAALHRAVDEGHFGYMPRHLVSDMQEAAAAWLAARHGWTVAPEAVRHVPDVIKAFEIAIEHFSKPGSKVIVPTPSYMPFLTIPQTVGREVIEVPLAHENGRFSFDLDALQAAFDQGGDLLTLCNPYNPVGRVFSEAELLDIVALVERNGGRVFSDEIWAPLVYPGNRHISYASLNDTAAAHTLTSISASKAFNLPGLKCAQVVVSNQSDAKKLDELGYGVGRGTSNLGVIAAATAFCEGGEWLSGVLAYLDRNRSMMAELVAEHLPGVRYEVPEGTYVAWLDFRDSAVADKPGAFFREHAGVALTEGTACGKVGAGHARFIMATPLPIMRQAFARMGRAMAENGAGWPANS